MTNYIEIYEQVKDLMRNGLAETRACIQIQEGAPNPTFRGAGTLDGAAAMVTVTLPKPIILRPPPQPTQHHPRPKDYVSWAKAAHLALLEQSRGLKTPRGEVERLLACYPGWRE